MAFLTFAPAEIEAALGHRYSVGSKIAAGGQGAVFRAHRTAGPDGRATNDFVALKVHFDPRQAIRVQREATALENLSHPNLERIIEHGHCYVDHRKTRYIAYEFIEGQSLKQRLKIGGKLAESEVLPIARDIAAAIAALWSQRIVHGDIKPSNIMLRDSGGAVLIDLGILRFFEEERAVKPLRPVGYFSPELARGWGTLGYLSPEQARGEKLSCASDIFSLGVVMMESLQGWHPTKGDQSALNDGLRASGHGLDVSPGLLSLLDKMLVSTPRSRGRLKTLSGYFQMLLQRMEEESAGSTPSYRLPEEVPSILEPEIDG
jgi:eukaryotic-like serine/threonine-protein kinase